MLLPDAQEPAGTCEQEMQPRLTFVVGAVHFDHHVIQLLLLQNADALSEGQRFACFTVLESFSVHLSPNSSHTYRLYQGWAKGVVNVAHSFGYTLNINKREKLGSLKSVLAWSRSMYICYGSVCFYRFYRECASTFALIASLVSITQLQSFIDASRRTAGNSSPKKT